MYFHYFLYIFNNNFILNCFGLTVICILDEMSKVELDAMVTEEKNRSRSLLQPTYDEKLRDWEGQRLPKSWLAFVLLGLPGLALESLIAEPAKSSEVKGRAGRAAMRSIKNESNLAGNKRPAEDAITMPTSYVAIKVEEINQNRRQEAIVLRQNKIKNFEKYLAMMEKDNETETDEYKDARKKYRSLLVVDEDLNAIPMFAVANKHEDSDASSD